MNKKAALYFFVFLLGTVAVGYAVFQSQNQEPAELRQTGSQSDENGAGPGSVSHPLMIEAMRDRDYPGSDIIIEQTLPEKANHREYVVSYLSDRFKIYALLTVPKGEMPQGGWPVIIFNHGSIPPAQYRTTERYIAYVDYFARRGYVVLKSDYRGHGQSEGIPDGGWYAPTYVTDVLNGLSSVQRLAYVNPEKIGMWGHSLGAQITISSMVVSEDIKVGVIWAGLTATHDQLFDDWRNRRRRANPNPTAPSQYGQSNGRRAELVAEYGTWQENPEFWQSVAPTSFLSDLSGPVQLHHGTADERVPVIHSQDLKERIKKAGKIAELFEYPGADHNLSQSFGTAMARSVAFFDQYLK